MTAADRRRTPQDAAARQEPPLELPGASRGYWDGPTLTARARVLPEALASGRRLVDSAGREVDAPGWQRWIERNPAAAGWAPPLTMFSQRAPLCQGCHVEPVPGPTAVYCSARCRAAAWRAARG